MRTLQTKRWLIPLLSILLIALCLGAAQAEGAQISGKVYIDRNNDGIMQSNESALPNTKVILQRRNEDGTTKDLSSKTISRNGDFAFAVNKAGEYRLKIDLPGGYLFTTPGRGSAALPAYKNKSYTPFFTLEDGSARVINIGASKTGAILSAVAFMDKNLNGGRSNSEPYLKGVKAELVYESEGTYYTVAEATSDRNGAIQFRDISPATYLLRVTLPDSYVIGPKGEKLNIWYNQINAGKGNTGISDPLELLPARTVSLGIGTVETGSLQGSLWYDENCNGAKDSGEKALTDTKVLLISPSLHLTRETVSDKNGRYEFTGVQPGDYKVGVQLGDGLVFTYPGYSAISAIGSYGEAAANVQVHKTTTMRDIGAMPSARINLSFYVDQNLNGSRDAGENGLANVSVTVRQMDQTVESKQTGTDGTVSFSSLRSGEAQVVCALPHGYIFKLGDNDEAFRITQTAALSQYTAQLPLNEENGNQYDGAVALSVPAQIRGKLFEDPDNTGVYAEECDLLPGFTVLAVTSDGQIMAQAMTDAMGGYQLYPLYAGDYTVHFLLNDPYVASPHTDDNDIVTQTPAAGETDVISLAPGQLVTDVNGAVFRAGVVDGSVSNAVDGGQSGIRGITVTLLDADGAPVSDFSYGVTDDTGYFMIKGVLPGQYTVRYELPETVAFAQGDERETESDAFTMTSGTECHLPDVQAVYTASVSGFTGRNQNAPIAVRLTLTNAETGEILETESSEENGEYRFSCLRPGDYTLAAQLPAGHVFGQLTGSPFGPKAQETDSVSLSLTPEDEITVDIRAALPVQFSGVVFYDADQSRTRDAQESPAAGRTLILWMNGERAAEITTDGSGEFSAANLVPGAYTVQIELQENEVLLSPDAEQQNNLWSFPCELDEDQSASIAVLRYAVLTGSVWNLDGSYNHVDMIPVTLLDANGKPLAQVTTNEKGDFGFSRLLPGTYSLSAEPPQDFIFAKEQDTAKRRSVIQSLADGEAQSIPFTVPMGKKVTGMDIGIGSIGRIGDKAWLDTNGNGMQDIGEPGMPGIKIELYRGGEFIVSATTDLYGRYGIDNLYPGEYEMRVTMHKELKATKHQTSFPLVASIMPESKDTTVTFSGVVVPSGGANLHCDLGFQLRKTGVYPAVMKSIPTKNWMPYSERKNP